MDRVCAEVELDTQWIKAVRGWVKRTLAPKTFDTPEETASYLKRIRTVELQRLTEDLLFSKGLLPIPHDKTDVSILDEIRDRVAKDLEKANERLLEAQSKAETITLARTPGTFEYTHLGHVREFYETHPTAPAMKELVEDTFKSVDQILSGGMLRFVTSWLNKWSGGIPFEPEPILYEYNLNGLKLILDGSDRYSVRNPRDLKKYLSYVLDAKGLLEAKGFQDLWYGQIFVSCKTCGGTNQYGAHLGVGGNYDIARDRVNIFSDPEPHVTGMVIHEMGHRYYFKFMSMADRAWFDSYFNEVKAVSDYGAKSTVEDFAEVFLHFVTNQDMSRDQINRFKSFLASKDRARLASPVNVTRRWFES